MHMQTARVAACVCVLNTHFQRVVGAHAYQCHGGGRGGQRWWEQVIVVVMGSDGCDSLMCVDV